VHAQDVQALIQVLAEAARGDLLRELAVRRDDEADVGAERRSFAWSAKGSSPISSRKSVPPSACSKRPRVRCTAPVKAPFS
jgi:hypothetical protein